jgi:hypothetical protein
MGVHGGGGSAVHSATLLRALLTPLATTLQKQTDTAGVEYLTLLVRCAAARHADGLKELVAALDQLPGLQPLPPPTSSVASVGVDQIPPPPPAKQEASSLLLPQPVLALLYALLWRARGCPAGAGEDAGTTTADELNTSLSGAMWESGGGGGLAAEEAFSATSSEAGEEPSSAFARSGVSVARGGARVVVRNLQVGFRFSRYLSFHLVARKLLGFVGRFDKGTKPMQTVSRSHSHSTSTLLSALHSVCGVSFVRWRRCHAPSSRLPRTRFMLRARCETVEC